MQKQKKKSLIALTLFVVDGNYLILDKHGKQTTTKNPYTSKR